ncbi:hypothetical protein A2U01_0075106, partial [Trifolium medium]|nr:hypothetical protein [Trifolium medium]
HFTIFIESNDGSINDRGTAKMFDAIARFLVDCFLADLSSLRL